MQSNVLSSRSATFPRPHQSRSRLCGRSWSPDSPTRSCTRRSTASSSCSHSLTIAAGRSTGETARSAPAWGEPARPADTAPRAVSSTREARVGAVQLTRHALDDTRMETIVRPDLVEHLGHAVAAARAHEIAPRPCSKLVARDLALLAHLVDEVHHAGLLEALGVVHCRSRPRRPREGASPERARRRAAGCRGAQALALNARQCDGNG